ncbi:expressed unknown protein [Seminavis robusta]|uniref:Uncharacterized protein n=1 Tax=Seminavis robusta TaxID=568900 RepID=A0A9N8DQX3_9STRA|nr:expressed unknown protein [Seminavis robusta]|eukprot:Sro307_g113380.1 n/a (163) ;mRNA; r:56507-56995
MSVQPYSIFSTINTTKAIDAPVSTVWPVLRAMDEWNTFSEVFDIAFKKGDRVVEVGQKIIIMSPQLPVNTVEQYDEIIEESRICWTLRGFQLLGLGSPPVLSPPIILRTQRCIELFDDGSGGTILHNWISYAGLGWPFICLIFGMLNKSVFNEFNSELAAQF